MRGRASNGTDIRRLAWPAIRAYVQLVTRGSDNRTKGMLTMRFLLTFHSGASGQWRCLDTALLPAFRSGRAEDLPAALRGEPDLVMRWMLGRYEIADALIPAIGSSRSAKGQRRLIAIYSLGSDQPVLGVKNEYHGVWLEMFLHENQPVGHIVASQVSARAGTMATLEERAARPLWTSDEACRQTVGRIIEHRDVLSMQRKTDAGREDTLTEKI